MFKRQFAFGGKFSGLPIKFEFCCTSLFVLNIRKKKLYKRVFTPKVNIFYATPFQLHSHKIELKVSFFHLSD